jgi:hypothetical protein
MLFSIVSFFSQYLKVDNFFLFCETKMQDELNKYFLYIHSVGLKNSPTHL